MNKKGQSILEYAVIGTLIILSVELMGPYVVRSIGAHFKMWDDQIQDSANEHHITADPNDFTNLPDCTCDAEETGACGAIGKTVTCNDNQRIKFKNCHPANCRVVEKCVDDTASCCAVGKTVRGSCGNINCSLSSNAPNDNSVHGENCCYGYRRLLQTCSSTEHVLSCTEDSSDSDGDISCAASCTGARPIYNGAEVGVYCQGAQTGLHEPTTISLVSNLASCATPAPDNTVPKCRMYCKDGFELTSNGKSCQPINTACKTFNVGSTDNIGQYVPNSTYVKVMLHAAGGGGAGGGTGGSSRDGGGGGGGSLLEAYVKLTPNTTYYFHVANNSALFSLGGVSGAGQGQPGLDGDSSWFSSSPTNAASTINLLAGGGKGGLTNVGGLGGTLNQTIGAECFNFYKGGNGGTIPGTSPGAGGGGGAGGAGLPGLGAGQLGTAGTIGEGKETEPPTLLGGAGGNGGYDQIGHGGTKGITPGGGAGGSGSGFKGGNGGAGEITICNVPDFLQHREDKYCKPTCTPQIYKTLLETRTARNNGNCFSIMQCIKGIDCGPRSKGDNNTNVTDCLTTTEQQNQFNNAIIVTTPPATAIKLGGYPINFRDNEEKDNSWDDSTYDVWNLYQSICPSCNNGTCDSGENTKNCPNDCMKHINAIGYTSDDDDDEDGGDYNCNLISEDPNAKCTVTNGPCATSWTRDTHCQGPKFSDGKWWLAVWAGSNNSGATYNVQCDDNTVTSSTPHDATVNNKCGHTLAWPK